MRVEQIEPKDRSAWDAFIMAHPAAIAWQGFAWSEVVARHYPLRFYPLAARDEEGAICGVLPLYRLLEQKGAPTLISVPFAVAGGIVANSPEAEQALLQRAIELADEVQAERIVFKQYKHRIEADLQTDENFYNRELNIARPADEIRQDLDERNRLQINRGGEMQPRLSFPSEEGRVFYDLLLRHSHRNGTPCPSRQWIADLVDSGMYSIALLYQGNQAVAGTMVKEFKATISFPFSCVRKRDDTGLSFIYFLYWELILLHAGRGIEIFHSGRIPRTDQTDAYRLGWGGTAYPYFNQYYPPSDRPTEFARKRGRKRQVLSLGWRALPRPVVERLGPRIVARYP